MRSASVCDNHLAEFYEAIKVGNLALMEKAEHQLTTPEKCVACAYIFKSKGTAKEALQQYLTSEGLASEIEYPISAASAEFIYWAIRFTVLAVAVSAVFLLVSYVKNNLLGVHSPFGIIDFIIIGLSALTLFIYIDDKFLE